MGMLSIPMAQAGRPQDVRNGEYGHRIWVGTNSTWEFSVDEPTYLLYGWAYLEEEWKVFPMPLKIEFSCGDIEFKVQRFTINYKIEEIVKPVYFFYTLIDPYTFSVGEHHLEIYYYFHGEIMLDLSHPINVLPADTPM